MQTEHPKETRRGTLLCKGLVIILFAATSSTLFSQTAVVTFKPYIQLGDNGTFGTKDSIVIAWQTNEASPNPGNYRVDFGPTTAYGGTVTPAGRVVDNYLAADRTLPVSPTTYGAHTNYTAVLSGLTYATTYQYRVSGPGMPSGGFTATFNTRKTTSVFSFAVEGDEGQFPAIPGSTNIVDYEARIANLIYNAANISLPGQPARPPAEFVLNDGDNVYTVGSEGTYRDYFFPIFNSDTASNELGAPVLRSMLYFISAGNHDLGSTGVSANLLADNSAPLFSGNLDGGDALSYFIDLYYPMNGPTGFDIQQTWNNDTSVANGFTLTYQGQTYTSPSAIEAFRASTAVDTGAGAKRQIDHTGNYSFDYGNAHFLFLDANPHLFNGLLDNNSATGGPPDSFTNYPTALRTWVINDLDSSKQLWKIVVFHQPAFSSGDATLHNSQMRAVAKVLEDHGVNMVFNGHEHNYQRTLPLRATSRTALAATTTAGSPAVLVDINFDGTTNTVPDGVLYMVEGAGGNRDFDGDYAPPRGSGTGLDQDDAAKGTLTEAPGLTVPQGPNSWLDTNLTNPEMVVFFPNAGTGTKITKLFKSKIFSFGHVVVNNNSLTLYQITEPLLSTSSATTAIPAPYGTDINGTPLNDPIPDTILDGANGTVLSTPATGTPALLDKFTVTKPDVSASVTAQLSAPPTVAPGGQVVYSILVSNTSSTALNGTQVRLTLPAGISFAGAISDTMTLQGSDVVATMGRLAPGAQQVMQITTQIPASAVAGTPMTASASVMSGTALPVATNAMTTKVAQVPAFPKF